MRNPLRSIGTKAALGGLALAVAVPSVALAANPFTDVPSGEWFTDAVDWAYNNDITTGKTPETFNGNDNVTRYESVTFLKRYHDEMVVPALNDIDAESLDGYEADGLARVSGERTEDDVDDWDGSSESIETTITAPTNGFLLVEYNATVTNDLQGTNTGFAAISGVLDVGALEAGRTTASMDLSAPWQSSFRTLNVSAVVPVTAGEHTVTGATGALMPIGNLAYIYDQSVTAVFIPFDGNGLPPL